MTLQQIQEKYGETTMFMSCQFLFHAGIDNVRDAGNEDAIYFMIADTKLFNFFAYNTLIEIARCSNEIVYSRNLHHIFRFLKYDLVISDGVRKP